MLRYMRNGLHESKMCLSHLELVTLLCVLIYMASCQSFGKEISFFPFLPLPYFLD